MICAPPRGKWWTSRGGAHARQSLAQRDRAYQALLADAPAEEPPSARRRWLRRIDCVLWLKWAILRRFGGEPLRGRARGARSATPTPKAHAHVIATQLRSWRPLAPRSLPSASVVPPSASVGVDQGRYSDAKLAAIREGAGFYQTQPRRLDARAIAASSGARRVAWFWRCGWRARPGATTRAALPQLPPAQ